MLLNLCKMWSIFVNEQLYGVIMYVCHVVLSYKPVYTYWRLKTVMTNQLQIYRKYLLFFKNKNKNVLIKFLIEKKLPTYGSKVFRVSSPSPYNCCLCFVEIF